jgi:ATP-binding cassette, subfamily C (CFTR/MRP), member 1
MRPLPSDAPLGDSELGKIKSAEVVKEDREKTTNVEFSKPEQATNKQEEKCDESLFKALHHTFFKRIWASAFLLVVSGKWTSIFEMYYCFLTEAYATDTLRTTTPLLNEVLLTWLTESYIYFRLSDAERTAAAAEGVFKPRGIGYGIGLAFALFVMQG